jgi:hypothetical protein
MPLPASLAFSSARAKPRSLKFQAGRFLGADRGGSA